MEKGENSIDRLRMTLNFARSVVTQLWYWLVHFHSVALRRAGWGFDTDGVAKCVQGSLNADIVTLGTNVR